jgi:hypothetical protein
MTTQMTFTIHTDWGHGWLEISNDDLFILGLTRSSFSEYSFQDRDGVYAEEDMDAYTAIKSHKKLFGTEPVIKNIHFEGDHPLRNKSRCAPKGGR